MARIKRGYVANRRRKKVLKRTKGFRGSSSKLFRSANQKRMKALVFSYRDRRKRKNNLKSLWISRINIKSHLYNLNYNTFIYKLKQSNIHINRKLLAQFAVQEDGIFNKLMVYLK